MNTFRIGDRVTCIGTPYSVEVLELGVCDHVDCGGDTFRFKDPETGDNDWVHAHGFVRAEGERR